MTKGYRFAFLLLLVLAVGAGLLYYSGMFSKSTPESTLRLSGTVEARQLRPGFLVSGRIARLQTDEGSAVREGQALASLDERDLKLALAAAQAQRDAAAASLAALLAGSRPQEIDVAKAALQQAEARLQLATVEVRRQRDLAKRKLTSQEQVDRSIAEQRAAHAAQAQAQAQLELLRIGPRKEDIERARAELAVREAALETAQQRLAYTQLYAPAAGTISARLSEAGNVVAVGQPVFEIDTLARPWIRAYLNESDLSRVTLGAPVEVHADGLHEPLRGTLSFISPRAEFTPKTVETHALRVDLVYRIKIDIDNPAGRLKLGMPVDLLLEVGTAEHASPD